MAVEFSEYRCKKKYKSKRRNIPVFRLLVFFTCVFLAFKFGLVDKVVGMLPLPGNDADSLVQPWDEQCRSFGGKDFELKDSLVQCSWIVNDSTPLLPNPFLRYLASIRKLPTAKLHWITTRDDFDRALMVLLEDSLVYTYFNIMLEDSSRVWVDASTGCRFPGLCPNLPLDWSNIPISENFDFAGLDRLISEDEFLGPGEAPLHPILPGVVVAAGKDSVGSFVEFDHGNNVVSRISGITLGASVGDTVDVNSVVGRLPPRDSAAFFLSVRRNGLFVRWADFYKSCHLADSVEIAKFRSQVGF
jgi:hypothetical protein